MVGPNDVFRHAHIVIQPFVKQMSDILTQRAYQPHLVEKAVLWSSFSAEGPRWLLRAGTGVVRVCGHTLYKVLSITPNDTNVYNRAMWIQDTPRTRLQRHTGGTVLQPSQP